ncbi:hypothetical protein BH09DEP1_BH09DEP1_6070 [soil metagenome]
MNGKHFALMLMSMAACLLLTVLGCWKVGNAIFAMDSYQLTINPLLSSNSKKIVKDIVAHNYNKPFCNLRDELLCACPAIKNIAVQRCANHQLKIDVDMHNPYMQIADTAVLLENGGVVSAQHFAVSALEKIPQIKIASGANPFEISKEFVAWLQSLNDQTLKDFSISWQDDYQIYLQHKQMPTQTILAGVNSLLNGEVIQVCQQIVDQKINLEQGTARVSWCADIRFDKQIIVSSHKGGASHG